ncbi:RsmB/NOP family class I SAM-dependent RNA methyltransferase [Sphingomonas swuensis]|uniref:RsmB/NOP family class I SAM-dependent RNA methyltransferase n=1 Tax=Sphingomonas swuensis TaxID=977800 RepID=A0ABP7SC65_9SPHN
MRQPTPRGAESGVDPRRAALRILDRVLRGGQTMDNAAQGGPRLTPGDQALTLAIVGETLRRLPLLDRLIDSATRQLLPDDSKARMVLRLALAQRIALNVPDHALVATALPLVEGGPRRLVHGVLGTLLRGDLPEADVGALPEAVHERWTRGWGDEAAASAERAIVRRPPLDLSFKTDEAALAFAAAEGGERLAERQVRLSDQRSVTSLPGFAEGDWWVQDLASTLPARMVPGDAIRVLDACAAPGGKTLQLAAAGHQVTALDRSESRLARLLANLARTGLRSEVVVADVLDWTPTELFDAVLLDAPCSATGTFRRHPEVLYRASPRIIAESAELQARLLAKSATWLRPGGSLVYAVCSLEPPEGEERIAAFLADHPDFEEAERRRVVPGEQEENGGMDGFFTARLVRTA